MWSLLANFHLFGPQERGECGWALDKAMELCSKLGIPIISHKTEGPSTPYWHFWALRLTSVRILQLREEKFSLLRREIRKWLGQKSWKRELLSIICQLQHSSCMIKPGRVFLTWIIALTSAAKELLHRIRLNRCLRSDLQWWAYLLPVWNGASMMVWSQNSVTITSDASGMWKCGANSLAER